MKTRIQKRLLPIALLVVGCLISWVHVAYGEQVLRYSCSAQVFAAFEEERIPAFIEATGINVELYICSSDTAVERLTNFYCDVASVARKLTYPTREQGYVETTLCKDPIAVIVNEQNPLWNMTEENLRAVFRKATSNWKDLGGTDQNILLVVPGRNTGLYQNFEQQVMKEGDMAYDVMTYLSTQVIDVVRRFPWAISFVSHGAATQEKGIRILNVDGRSPTDKGYPFQQDFSLVTRGRPAGLAKVFLDFALSEKGKKIITSRGMIPAAP